MIPEWKLKVIKVGRIAAERSGLTHFRGAGVKLEVPIWIVAATDGVHKVLVDSGIDDYDWVVEGPEPNCLQREEEQTLHALKAAAGWEPEEVDLLINTHLHFDHCGCNDKFKNAEICVQRKEYETAFEPIESERKLYCRRFFDKKAVPYFQWKFVDGEAQILPGLLVFPTPGHTRGHQSVLFHTREGAVCVAGDVVSIDENINGNIETNIVVNTKDVYESFRRIRRIADYIIPGHEPTLADQGQSGFIRIEPYEE